MQLKEQCYTDLKSLDIELQGSKSQARNIAMVYYPCDHGVIEGVTPGGEERGKLFIYWTVGAQVTLQLLELGSTRFLQL